MKLTAAMKKWLVENCDVKADATDDEFTAAASKALVAGSLSADKYAELTKATDVAEANQFGAQLKDIAGLLTQLVSKDEGGVAVAPVEPVTEPVAPVEPVTETPVAPVEPVVEPVVAEGDDKSSDDWYEKVYGRLNSPASPSQTDAKEFAVRVKGAHERYASTKTAAIFPEKNRRGLKHQLAGQQISDFGRTLDMPSDLDKALAGVWAKFQIATSQRGNSGLFGYQALNEHDKGLFHYLVEKTDWDNSEDTKARTRKGYGPGGVKDLIDDATSGGLEAAPIVFDDAVIQAPLLFGELFPLVNTIPLDRGRRIEGVSTGTVTGAWGGVDATAITLFTTTSFVSAFDTTVFRWEGAIRIGLDFLSDTPVDFGSHITTQYGERLQEDLDDVIAAGNGTTQPEGVMNKTGAATAAFSSTTTLSNYETLRSSVAKPEHGASVKNTAVFCGNETSYFRARAIAVGAADVRRIFGMDYDSYSIMERPFKLNETLANTQLFYAILGRYRMYRRRGITMRQSTEGDTLIRRNSMLIVATARYGGQMERGAACGVVTDAPA